MRHPIDSATTLLDALSALVPGSSRTTLRQMLAAGRVRVNGEVEKNAKRALVPGDVIDVARKEHHALLPPEIALLFEDEHLLVVVKPAGLLTVSTESERERTLQAALNGYLRAKGLKDRIHVVHRLDRESSGVLVFAKSYEIREALKERFANHDIERVYVAVVEGVIDPPAGTIRTCVREGKDLMVRSVDPRAFPDAKPAVTHYRTLRAGPSYALLEVTLETGRKNQIRAHLSEAGHPIAGDARYGAKTDPIGRLALHARLLGFAHPITGRAMRFEAPVPDAFASLRG
ncbi:MAG TPA: RluA family pseudouridine synthase [Thermoanaerobaculia bacterium]